jgi:hypothetical protein
VTVEENTMDNVSDGITLIVLTLSFMVIPGCFLIDLIDELPEKWRDLAWPLLPIGSFVLASHVIGK